MNIKWYVEDALSKLDGKYKEERDRLMELFEKELIRHIYAHPMVLTFDLYPEDNEELFILLSDHISWLNKQSFLVDNNIEVVYTGDFEGNAVCEVDYSNYNKNLPDPPKGWTSGIR